jgi:hypothetical protein
MRRFQIIVTHPNWIPPTPAIQGCGAVSVHSHHKLQVLATARRSRRSANNAHDFNPKPLYYFMTAHNFSPAATLPACSILSRISTSAVLLLAKSRGALLCSSLIQFHFQMCLDPAITILPVHYLMQMVAASCIVVVLQPVRIGTEALTARSWYVWCGSPGVASPCFAVGGQSSGSVSYGAPGFCFDWLPKVSTNWHCCDVLWSGCSLLVTHRVASSSSI